MRLLLILLLASLPLGAEEILSTTNLKVVRVFAFGGVGYAGKTSPGELAIREVMQGETPRHELEGLIKEGNPQAQFYAIAAFRLIDQQRFEELLESYSKRQGKVLVGWGCIQANMEYSDVIMWMREGRLIAPQSLIDTKAEQASAEQPATLPESDSEGSDNPQPEAEGRPR